MSKYRDDSPENIGLRIGQIRDSLGLTLEEFGKLVDPIASKSNVSKWEKGMSKPNRKRTKRIAELGGMTAAELLGTRLKTNNSNATGERIKDIRVNKCGVKLQQFAEMIDSGKSNVSRWERGENVPNDLTLKKIAEIGNISVAELLEGNEIKTVEEIINEIKESFTDEEIKQIIRKLI